MTTRACVSTIVSSSLSMWSGLYERSQSMTTRYSLVQALKAVRNACPSMKLCLWRSTRTPAWVEAYSSASSPVPSVLPSSTTTTSHE